MTTTTDKTTDVPVRKAISVKASPERAFRVFTEEFDSWWPRTHHIGRTPMTRAIVEGRVGGRCYSEHTDGTECMWGTVLQWDPPSRIVLAWHIDGRWQFQPDLRQSSEVEIRFIPEPRGQTRVELEHRYLARHGADAHAVRKGIDSPDGWSALLQLYLARAEQLE